MPGRNHDDVTLGEVYRRLCDIDERHSAQLADIVQQAKITNGRTTKLETRVDGHDRELLDVKRVSASPPEVAELVTALKALRMFKGLAIATWVTGGAIVGLMVWLVRNVRLAP